MDADIVFAPSVGPEAGVEVEDDPTPAPAPPGAEPLHVAPTAQDGPVAPIPFPDGPAEVARDEPDEPDDDDGRAAVWLWVLFVILLLAALAAAAFWFWPQIEARAFPRLDAPTEQPADGGPLTAAAGAPASDAPRAEAPDADSTRTPATDGLAAPPPAGDGGAAPMTATSSPGDPAPAAGDRRALAPPDGQAILPPVLAGLSADDRDALSGRSPVDPEAAAWTLVVLSTPSRDDAEALVRRYRRAGYRASVLATQSGGRAMYRVAVGQFGMRDDALRLRDRLPPQAPPDTWALDLQTL